MPECPHCSTRITREELLQMHRFTPRVCNMCGEQYIRGGMVEGISVVMVAGIMAATIGQQTSTPGWLLALPVVAAAIWAAQKMVTSQPLKSEEARWVLLKILGCAMVIGVVVSSGVRLLLSAVA